MSATNRGAVRNASDFYATPKGAFDPILPFIAQVSANVWEPACGDGRLIKWMNESGKILADGSDINAKISPTNFLTDSQYRECIVTNPPFSLAFNFCQHGVHFSEHLFLLLRLNFLASGKRKVWFIENEPDALFVLSSRPSFTPDGKTDATDYAWYYWGDYDFKPFNHL